jgi:hypothetical protein
MPTVSPYERLSVRGQTARLRRLAANALHQWALADPSSIWCNIRKTPPFAPI